MDEIYHKKACIRCGEEFKTLIEEYTECIYCWYDKTFPRTINQIKRIFTTGSVIR